MKISNQKGQGLLELLVALFILVSALAASVVLIVTSINAGRESRNRLLASNLAREGIEVVRNIRDGNWSDPSGVVIWDDGLVLVGDNTAVPIIDNTNPISLDFGPDNFTDQNARIKQLDNQYLQGTATGTDTLFYRLLYLNPICHDGSGNEQIVDKESVDDCSSFVGYSKVGIRIISEVRWPKDDSNKKVIIEDRLYNWQVL